MADSSISILTSDDNPIQHTINGMPAISSFELADHFDIRHHHVLRDIKAIIKKIPDPCWHETNFGVMYKSVATSNNAVRKVPYYVLTRDAFCLLAMGFTGTVAIN